MECIYFLVNTLNLVINIITICIKNLLSRAHANVKVLEICESVITRIIIWTIRGTIPKQYQCLKFKSC